MSAMYEESDSVREDTKLEGNRIAYLGRGLLSPW